MPYEKIPEQTRDMLSSALNLASDGKPGEFKAVFDQLMKSRAIDVLGDHRQSMFGGHGYTNNEDY